MYNVIINTFFSSHNSHLVAVVVMVRTIKIYYCSNFQVYNMVLLMIVTVL